MAEERLFPESLVFFLRIPVACSSVVGMMSGALWSCGNWTAAPSSVPRMKWGHYTSAMYQVFVSQVGDQANAHRSDTQSPLYSHCQGNCVDFTFLI